MSNEGLKEYISGGHYFSDARKWYTYKYLSPVTHKVWAFYTACILVIMLAAACININQLLPIKQTISYGISVENKNSKTDENANIIRMDDTDTKVTPVNFIATTLLQNYITHRESYDYKMLTKQFLHIRNSSTRIIFKRFYDYMNINNPDSPVIRYQKYAKRNIVINDVSFTSNNEAIVEFRSIAKDSGDKIFENLKWQARIGFDMSDIKNKLPGGSKFNFTVTDYKLKILEAK